MEALKVLGYIVIAAIVGGGTFAVPMAWLELFGIIG